MYDNDALLILRGKENNEKRKELEDNLMSVLKELSTELVSFTPSNKELEEANKVYFHENENGLKVKGRMLGIINRCGMAHQILSELMKFDNPVQYMYLLHFISEVDNEVLKFSSKFNADYLKSAFEESRRMIMNDAKAFYSSISFPGAVQFSPPSTDIFQGGM